MPIQAGNIFDNIKALSQAQTAKIDRKLYVGNLPPQMNQQLLLNIMNKAMRSLKEIKEPGNPVISAWISTDSHYAFIEFRNAEEANLGFKLAGMTINGSDIKIGRPKAYEGYMKTPGIPSFGAEDGQGMEGEDGASDGGADDAAKVVSGRHLPETYFVVSMPSRVLRISNICTF